MHNSAFLLHDDQRTIDSLEELNLNSVFISSDIINSNLIEKIKLKKNDIKIYISTSVFEGKNLLDKYTDSAPVEAGGIDTQTQTYCGICPTHLDVREALLSNVKRLTSLNIDGIWLDHIRYPSVWNNPNPIIMDTCYCDRCLAQFSGFIDEKIEGNNIQDKALLIDGSYYYEWLDFKTNQITSFIKDAKDILELTDKKIQLGVFIVPWKDEEYGQALKRVIAQDFSKIFPLIDLFSPMFYHTTLSKSPEWIKEMVNYYWETGKAFLPIVQVSKTAQDLSDSEFEKVLNYASGKPSLGVCVNSLDDLICSPEKFNVFKNFSISG